MSSVLNGRLHRGGKSPEEHDPKEKAMFSRLDVQELIKEALDQLHADHTKCWCKHDKDHHTSADSFAVSTPTVSDNHR